MTASKMNPATERMAKSIETDLRLLVPAPIEVNSHIYRAAIIAGVAITIDAVAKSQPIYTIDAKQIKKYLAKQFKEIK